jgi:opacity protein-like surface antigen
MKKLVLCAAIAALAFTTVDAARIVSAHKQIAIGEAEWMKSEAGTWTGMHDSKKVWYKLNTKDATLWWSTDGKKWEAVGDGMWQDKDGKWLKINDKKLVWSADGGKTWVEVPDWTWQDADGNWCKFDKDWTLWMKKGM